MGGPYILIFGHEKAINIFGYWKAIIILWNIFTWGQLGHWEIWGTWTLGNLQTTWIKLVQTYSNLFKMDKLVQT